MPAETYEGKACRHCGGNLRYRSNRHCVRCVNAAFTTRHDAAREDPIYRYLEQLVNRRRRALQRISQRTRRHADG